METVRTYSVRDGICPETWSQLGVDLEAIVIGSQLERESRVGLLSKHLLASNTYKGAQKKSSAKKKSAQPS